MDLLDQYPCRLRSPQKLKDPGTRGTSLVRPFPIGYNRDVPADHAQKVRSLLPAKALAIAAYGESVDTYRYRTLSTKTSDPAIRDEFIQMADEEQGHLAAMQQLIEEYFPGDFVLTPEDKALIIVGQRLLDAYDDAALAKVMPLIIESERLTGRFYGVLAETMPRPDLKPFFQEMADECFDHAERLTQLRIGSGGS